MILKVYYIAIEATNVKLYLSESCHTLANVQRLYRRSKLPRDGAFPVSKTVAV